MLYQLIIKRSDLMKTVKVIEPKVKAFEFSAQNTQVLFTFEASDTQMEHIRGRLGSQEIKHRLSKW
ncbi:MAG: hypothetical protein IAE79_07595 [Anaerolinea sp.]|nr:hypothetical protein [Anaerolinea sp.]